ncbi:FAM96B protein [Apiospora phragmitis]|uniref:FAM96B protein n=1 Tax=Apiospora phragmitis TaxID=2905665 RepID=A0ABR1V0T5_9PEZI
MDNKDNANPTILTASELPTRQIKKRKTPVSVDDAKFADAVSRRPLFLSDPFCDVSWSDGTESDDDFVEEPIDEQRSTHPISLGQLAVVNLPDVGITPPPSASCDPNALRRVLVKVTPTITHCSLATVLGLGVRVRLEQALPPNYRVDVVIKEGSHSQDDQVNKQLADKERVAAALENDTLKGVLDKMLETCA